ncbi:MAG: hypothetical protein HGA61_01700 [Candidatus Moranbacteria bacterium]|nr:hypothetical protein [Candidatus Moranbacteria bacterium]
MNHVQTWGEAITISLLQLWDKFINFLPALVGALLVFLIGMMLATIFGKIVSKIIHTMKIDQAIDRFNVSKQLKEVGFEFLISQFLGELVKWFLVLVFLMAATDILGLAQVTEFLNNIILYLPNVVVATVILTIALVMGNITYMVVRGSVQVAGIMSATLLASISKWAIVIFGILAALIQLGIATSLVNTIFIGLVSALSLATGLSFGLGGKDEAAMILKKIREGLGEKR